jgi:hypothetical protein
MAYIYLGGGGLFQQVVGLLLQIALSDAKYRGRSFIHGNGGDK